MGQLLEASGLFLFQHLVTLIQGSKLFLSFPVSVSGQLSLCQCTCLPVWPDSQIIFHIWPFTAMKLSQTTWQSSQSVFKILPNTKWTLKKCLRLSAKRQNLPNLVTLVTLPISIYFISLHFEIAKFVYFRKTVKLEKKQMWNIFIAIKNYSLNDQAWGSSW